MLQEAWAQAFARRRAEYLRSPHVRLMALPFRPATSSRSPRMAARDRGRRAAYSEVRYASTIMNSLQALPSADCSPRQVKCIGETIVYVARVYAWPAIGSLNA
jgi:hypothetical protein